MSPGIDEIVSHAAEACRSFADCSAMFFNFEKRSSWLGWENWLTVEIIRRLKSPLALPFYSYPTTDQRLDIYIDAPVRLAVEIKTNYITDLEAKKSPRPMSGRVVEDAAKITVLGADVDKLLLVSTCFESAVGLIAYPACLAEDLKSRFGQFQSKWIDCSGGSGHNLLLAMSIRHKREVGRTRIERRT